MKNAFKQNEIPLSAQSFYWNFQEVWNMDGGRIKPPRYKQDLE